MACGQEMGGIGRRNNDLTAQTDLSLNCFLLREGAIRNRSIITILFAVLAAAIGIYFLWFHSSKPATPLPVKYVTSPSLDLLNTPAVVHEVLNILKYGDRVEVLREEGRWTKVRTSTGSEGYVLAEELVPSKTYEDGQTLLHQLSSRQVQASGQAALAVNIHLEPARDAPELGMLTQGENLQVFDRRVVARKAAAGVKPIASGASVPDVWYLVRSGKRAGWVLGRMVTLDIPQAISQYAANYNTVAWFVLNTVRDGDANVPQYLVADREGTVEFDFTHIRVFTWSLRTHRYVTSYVQSGLKGVFPIRVEHIDNVPYFRLRLVGKKGYKFQRVYGLFNTILRPIGDVEGWESNAMPARRRR